uniref:Uncharacterized protein n=1 Tax=Steinernema glaseri TaxID=37863 RepID=A0A1I7ZKW6_9BILA
MPTDFLSSWVSSERFIVSTSVDKLLETMGGHGAPGAITSDSPSAATAHSGGLRPGAAHPESETRFDNDLQIHTQYLDSRRVGGRQGSPKREKTRLSISLPEARAPGSASTEHDVRISANGRTAFLGHPGQSQIRIVNRPITLRLCHFRSCVLLLFGAFFAASQIQCGRYLRWPPFASDRRETMPTSKLDRDSMG